MKIDGTALLNLCLEELRADPRTPEDPLLYPGALDEGLIERIMAAAKALAQQERTTPAAEIVYSVEKIQLLPGEGETELAKVKQWFDFYLASAQRNHSCDVVYGPVGT